MNILFLIFSFNTGGIERLIIDMANEMTARNNNLYLCIINNDYTSSLISNLDSSVKVIYLNRPIGSNKKIKYMNVLSKKIVREHIDIVHCHGMNCVLFSCIAKIRSPHVHFYNTVHDVPDFTSYAKWQIIAENLICDKIIAISHTVEKEIVKRKVANKKIITIFNAVNTEKFLPKNTKETFCIDNIVIGNVARFIPEKKGQNTLINAIKILKKKYPQIQCHFAGAADDAHQEEYHLLLDSISDSNLKDNIFFHGNVENIPSFLDKIDIFVLPSIYEGFGISLIEAMSMGIRCIASNVDGPSEIIYSRDLGLLFDVNSVTDLVEKLDYMIMHYYDYDSNKISSYIKDKYNIHNMVSQHINLYKEKSPVSKKYFT